MANRGSWTEILQSLGAAILDLFKLEIKAATQDFKVFFKQVAMLAGVAVLMLFVLFYVPFLVLFSVLDGIQQATGWPYWGSGLALTGLVFVVLSVIGAVAYFIVIRKMESPQITVQRRLDDHRGWWRNDVLEEPRRLDNG